MASRPTSTAGEQGRAAGWWQGHEAWSNLCAGGTMGVVYGAGSLWQWAHRGDEPGQSDFFLAPGAGWREALDFEGSRYVGLVARILDGLPTPDMAPNWEVTLGRRGLLVPGKLFICYSDDGGPLLIFGDEVPEHYRIVDPRTGAVVSSGVRPEGANGFPASGARRGCSSSVTNRTRITRIGQICADQMKSASIRPIRVIRVPFLN